MIVEACTNAPAPAATRVTQLLAGRTLLVDLRICQLWRERGIPRYMHNLLKHMAIQAPDLRLLFLYERRHQNPLAHDELTQIGRVVFDDLGDCAADLPRVDGYLISTFFLPPPPRQMIEYLLPPVLLRDRPSLFGIVYDFIPKLFPDVYLPTHGQRQDYERCVEVMRRCAHLFAISETTRRDGIQLADLDPSSVTNVYGSIDEEKWQSALSRLAAEVAPHLQFPFGRLERGKYFVYVAGDDWRKNMDGLIRGYALARSRAEGDSSPYPVLVIACSMYDWRREYFYGLARDAGLQPGSDLILTGELTDDDLVRLMRGALASVYASIYEGLGLPILESYACGTPAVGSNVASLAELLLPDCAFDPKSDDAIATTLNRIRADVGLREASVAFGASLRERINWRATTAQVLERIAETLPSGGPPRQRFAGRSPGVAIFAALPPAETGVARFTRDTLRSAGWTSHVFADFASADALSEANRELRNSSQPRGSALASPLGRTGTFPLGTFDLLAQQLRYPKRLYILGNSVHHLGTLSAALRYGRERNAESFLYLHEANQAGLWACYCHQDFLALKHLFAAHYPALQKDIFAAPALDDLLQLRCYGVRPIVALTGIQRIIVNSEACRQLVAEDLGAASSVQIDVAFHPFLDAEPGRYGQHPRPSAGLVAGHFGTIGPHKQIGLLGEACQQLAEDGSLALVLAGFDIRASMLEHRFIEYPFHHFVDSPSSADLLRWMNTVDVAVQLRRPFYGEWSGCINQLLSLDQKVIVTRGTVEGGLRPSVVEVSPEVTSAELAQTIRQVASGAREHRATRLLEEYSIDRYQECLASILRLD